MDEFSTKELLRKSDIPAVLIPLFLIGIFSGLLYWEGLGSIGSGEEIGFFVNIENQVNRKGVQDSIWTRAVYPLYNHDRIRTDDQSSFSAQIGKLLTFSLEEKSMVVVSLPEEASPEFVLEAGKLSLRKDSFSGTPVITIAGKFTFQFISGDFEVRRDADSVLVYSAGKWKAKGGKEELESQGGTYLFKEDGTIQKGQSGAVIPSDNHVIVSETFPLDVEFVLGDEKNNEVEIGPKRDFKDKKKVTGEKGRAWVSLTPGVYYWRIANIESRYSNVRKLTIRKKEKIHLLKPVAGETISTQKEKTAKVNLLWARSEDIQNGYQIDIYSEKNRKTPLLSEKTFRNFLTLSLPPGKYNWTVGTESLEAVGGSMQLFEVIAEKEKSAPAITTSPDAFVQTKKKATQFAVISPKGTVNMTGKNSLSFRWKPPEGYEQFTLKIKKASGEVVFEKTLTGSSYTLTKLDVLDVGKFQFEVSAEPSPGSALERIYGSGNFQIILPSSDEAPKLEMDGGK